MHTHTHTHVYKRMDVQIHTHMHIHTYIHVRTHTHKKKNSRGNGGNAFLRWVASVVKRQVQLIDKLDETCTNAEDRMMLVQHRSGDRVMS